MACHLAHSCRLTAYLGNSSLILSESLASYSSFQPSGMAPVNLSLMYSLHLQGVKDVADCCGMNGAGVLLRQQEEGERHLTLALLSPATAWKP